MDSSESLTSFPSLLTAIPRPFRPILVAMPSRRPQSFWIAVTAIIIAAGLLSRSVRTGFILFDKYLGDALYAAMVYALLRIFTGRIPATISAMSAMTAIELFQLTLIPARLLANDHWPVRVIARLMGVHFSVLDLAAYAAGIGVTLLLDSSRIKWR